MQKNILFLVTGMTPQIITETVYALAADPENTEKWVPHEIHVLTTEKGLIQIKSHLFNDGIFEKLLTDFCLPKIKFDDSTLHVIMRDGEELKDLKTIEDNELAANETCRLIKLFTQNEQTTLHVSIAGGRKTMGFYAGYALSLYGRAQDSMSHVLVSQEFEFATNFYYPTPYEYYVGKYNSQERLNAQDAKVFLANIPFVRLRDALPHTHPLKIDSYKFSDVVEQINQANQNLSLEIDVINQSIKISGGQPIDIPAREIAMLMWFACNRLEDKKGIKAPTAKAKGENSYAEIQIAKELTVQYLSYYDQFKDGETCIEMNKEFFETTKSKLKQHLNKKLGAELAARILPKQNGRNMPFYLPIEKEDIIIKDTFKERAIPS